ncbi:MAG: electron transfer flavoprotein subunit alpha/FixB family protein [Actinomycetaceae bacterium]|nr:electron transfer flavoprotein subunit alpha/FixB family protein [Actinomycetaceae bacterium]
MSFSLPVLVVVDHVSDEDGTYRLTVASKELLTTARRLTDATVLAIALCPEPEMDQLAKYGTDTVYVADLQGRSPRIGAVVVDAVNACLQKTGKVAAILVVSNYRGREVAAGLASILDSGAAVDVTRLSARGGKLVAGKTILSGSWETIFQIHRGTPIVGLRPSAVLAEVVNNPISANREDVQVTFRPETTAVQLVSSAALNGDGPALTEAEVVVCGGRGTNGDFSQVNKLAEIFGGAVGATRVAADEGWVERSLQIGQTGETIAPKLYVGLGVSGAIHHTCGMQSAQTIVAVCDDPDAPIFEMCDFGVVGKLEDVVPPAIEALQ